jgi:hypothetical protein
MSSVFNGLLQFHLLRSRLSSFSPNFHHLRKPTTNASAPTQALATAAGAAAAHAAVAAAVSGHDAAAEAAAWGVAKVDDA